MKPLSITFYYGQIKPEYRGNLALFMEVPEQKPVFACVPLESSELTAATSGMHSPMRAYLGVNESAQHAMMARFNQGKISSAHNLDAVIVRDDILQRRVSELFDFQYASLEAAIATGK